MANGFVKWLSHATTGGPLRWKRSRGRLLEKITVCRHNPANTWSELLWNPTSDRIPTQHRELMIFDRSPRSGQQDLSADSSSAISVCEFTINYYTSFCEIDIYHSSGLGAFGQVVRYILVPMPCFLVILRKKRKPCCKWLLPTLPCYAPIANCSPYRYANPQSYIGLQTGNIVLAGERMITQFHLRVVSELQATFSLYWTADSSQISVLSNMKTPTLIHKNHEPKSVG
ncbi:hypothetical protein J1614_005606 [Plenodomus biglobosus]|nr:hypothetical protein J1614_005606 [Plenodomus biglobosus]